MLKELAPSRGVPSNAALKRKLTCEQIFVKILNLEKPVVAKRP